MTRAIQNFHRALERFREALEWEESPATRDSAILRFELSYETAWKAAQVSVREEGFAVNGPRQSFQAAFQLGWIDDEEVWDAMIRARNNAVHTYNEAFAKQMYASLGRYLNAMEFLRGKLSG